jgi:chromate transporter
VGGPAVEATRGDLKFTAPLTGITAAVVGVILNLALFFAYHVLWPKGISTPLSAQSIFAGFEWFSLLVGFAAFIALFRYKASIMQVISACAALGLAFSFIKPLLA